MVGQGQHADRQDLGGREFFLYLQRLCVSRQQGDRFIQALLNMDGCIGLQMYAPRCYAWWMAAVLAGTAIAAQV